MKKLDLRFQISNPLLRPCYPVYPVHPVNSFPAVLPLEALSGALIAARRRLSSSARILSPSVRRAARLEHLSFVTSKAAKGGLAKPSISRPCQSSSLRESVPRRRRKLSTEKARPSFQRDSGLTNLVAFKTDEHFVFILREVVFVMIVREKSAALARTSASVSRCLFRLRTRTLRSAGACS